MRSVPSPATADEDHPLALPVEELAISCVHMWVDRLCRWENRRQESVTYALLAGAHEARAASGTRLAAPADGPPRSERPNVPPGL